jgi:hypothetical protein
MYVPSGKMMSLLREEPPAECQIRFNERDEEGKERGTAEKGKKTEGKKHGAYPSARGDLGSIGLREGVENRAEQGRSNRVA